MKTNRKLFKTLLLGRLLPLLTSLLLMAVSCEKEELSEIERLPAATQEGKNTFGCLINGKAFVPNGNAGFGVPPLRSFYQYLFEDFNPVKGHFFEVSAGDYRKEGRFIVVVLGTNALELKEGETYHLTGPDQVGRAFAMVDFSPIGLNSHKVVSPLTGELRITKFDQQRGIVAGTFWFDAVNSQGEKVEVREGRFDMRYHQ
ncbi:hypothetical protein [Rufibacter sp. LB8]|uniref:hypothetical protein n=1 Tax=Rufibacter sp. LB8 TaxID=2777781 RepID=UPI00178C3DEF|nr:hypothetical protein [Rufibacter sp. LB8]